MTAPKRIQRKRTKGWRMPEGAVYVGRPTRWGNPWRIVPVEDHHFAFGDAADVRHATEDRCIGRFDRITRSRGTGAPYWATRQFEADVTTEFEAQIRAELAGKDLACWCPLNQPCHADVLLDLANRPHELPSYPAVERDHRLAVIHAHLPTLIRMRTDALLQYREVESWTLPAEWDPGEHPNPPARPVDAPVPPAKVLGRPVRFEGNRIVAHWSDPDADERRADAAWRV